MKFIVAVDEKWGIGKNGDLLLSIPGDMQYFRETTRNAVLVMGYNTLISFPNSKPLPGRLNIVLADIEGLKVPRTVVCNSMDQLLKLIGCFDPDDVFVIGGGSIYRQLMPYCRGAHITKMRFCGDADTSIPSLDEKPEWSAAEESETYEHEGIKYSFVIYRNAAPTEIALSEQFSSDMSVYFKKKADLTVPYADDAAYKKELKALLRAYFKPLADGFGAEDVDSFFASGSPTFESYLKEKKLIASAEDFTALAEKYSVDANAKTVNISKETYLLLEEMQ